LGLAKNAPDEDCDKIILVIAICLTRRFLLPRKSLKKNPKKNPKKNRTD
jgi:hypothetical protein